MTKDMKLELEPLELSTVECVRKDQDIADSLQQIRLKLIKQGEKEGVFKDYLIPVK